MTDTGQPSLRVPFACRTAPPPRPRRRFSRIGLGVIAAVILTVGGLVLPGDALPTATALPCPDGSQTCGGPQPTFDPGPTQGPAPTTAPHAPTTTVPGYTPDPPQGNQGAVDTPTFHGGVRPMPTPDHVGPNSCIFNCGPAATQAPAPTGTQEPTVTGTQGPTATVTQQQQTGTRQPTGSPSVSEPARESSTENQRPTGTRPARALKVNAEGPLRSQIEAAVQAWRHAGAQIELTDASTDVPITVARSPEGWEGVYLPDQGVVDVNSRTATTPTEQTRVVTHELGHALGLTDTGSPFMRGDSDAPTAVDAAAVAALPACAVSRSGPEYLCPFHYDDGGCVGGSIVGGDKAIPEVTVPPGYVYDPDCKKMPSGQGCFQYSVHHDYCSGSPDQFPSPGANADFTGPCARHDMCLDGDGPKGVSDAALWSYCNKQLHAGMLQNCRRAYGVVDSRLGACIATAAVYYDAVTANGLYDVMVGAPK